MVSLVLIAKKAISHPWDLTNNRHDMCQIWCARTNRLFACIAMRCTYHHPAISLRDEPPHRLLARYVVKCDSAAPMLFNSVFKFGEEARVGKEQAAALFGRLAIVASRRSERAGRAGHAKSGLKYGTKCK